MNGFHPAGMKERRIAAENEASSDMAIAAAIKALENCQIKPEEIDLIIVATATPDHLMPSTAPIVQAKIGAVNATAFDLSAACTGYLYGLSTAKAFIESEIYKNILLIAVDKMSAFMDAKIANTFVLFGDGASAAIITGKGAGLAIESICLGSDGTLSDLTYIPAGGSRYPHPQKPYPKDPITLKWQVKKFLNMQLEE